MPAANRADKIPRCAKLGIALRLGASAAVLILGCLILKVRLTTLAVPRSVKPAQISETKTDAVPGYAGSTACRNCHEEEYQAWAPSHHALAERLPGTTLDEKCFPTASDVQFGPGRSFVRKRNASYEVVPDDS